MVDFEMAKDKVLLGSERRSMAMTEREKRTTAWHEAGHTLVAWLLPASDPVYKVTIIPRGPALGITQTLPENDPKDRSREWCYDTIAMALGGRIAEEVKFGQLTTGASSDFQRASDIARQMVTAWGMSRKLGTLAYGEKDDSPFMMGPSMRSRNYSERTQQEIDAEIRSIVQQQYDRARALLEEHSDQLDAIAEALLERETLDREDLEALLSGRELPPQKQIRIPRYSEKRAQKEKRKTSIFQPRPREVPSGG
jgi:cell division protease FtsH